MAIFKTSKFFTNLSTTQKSDSVEIRIDSSVRNKEIDLRTEKQATNFSSAFSYWQVRSEKGIKNYKISVKTS